MDKRKLDSPIKVCQYDMKCFRLNPEHFDECSHPHLESIVEIGEEPSTGEFVIPENWVVARVKVQAQLKIIKAKQSQNGNAAKVRKVDSEDVQEKIDLEEPMEVEVEPETASKQSEAVVNNSVVMSAVESPPKKVPAQSIADFFRERRRAFEARDPATMRAPSPPPAVPDPAPITRQDEATAYPVIPQELQQYFPTVLPKGRMAEKLRQAAPYNMFLTTVTESPTTYFDPSSVTFLDLLDSSLGELESSVQINFVVHIGWLLAQYTVAKCDRLPLLIVHGREDPNLSNIGQYRPNISQVFVKVPNGYGCHHSKVMLLFYKDKSMRVVVSTANLYPPDWDNRTQGIWVSDRLPQLDNRASVTGESETNFRGDLVRYLKNYNITKLQPYIDRINESDFSSVKIFLVTSVPGSHSGDVHGLRRLGSLLNEHSAPMDEKASIVMQTSAVGNFGKSSAEYLCDGGEVARNFMKHSGANGAKTPPKIQLIYPTLKNVQQSHEGVHGADCLPYRQGAHEGQLWLNRHLYQWKCESLNRSGSTPHIKTYCRFSESGLFWFVLTSANMSKGAWGVTKKKNKREDALFINNYEAGVAFFPRVILDGKNQFPMNAEQQREDVPIFRVPFDLPPVLYDSSDVPFCSDSRAVMMLP